jgi:hypothetical protein
MAQAGWGGYFYLHQQWLEGWQGVGSASGENGYETLDQDIFKACNEIFEQDFHRILNLPHLFLTGLPQEGVNRATEKFNQFQAAMAEFIYFALSAGEEIPAGHEGSGGGWQAGKSPGRLQGLL